MIVDALFVGEDPGGVDVIVPISKRLTPLGVSNFALSSGAGRAVWQRHGIPFEDISGAVADPVDGDRIRQLLASRRPKVLVTSTSFPRGVEKVFRREARRLGIPSIMVVDADRADLYRNEPEELASRPDWVVSIGRRVTRQLAAAGYDQHRIITTGHLALADIAATGRSIPDAEIAAWKRDFMETTDGRELIVIFSDNITQVYGESGALAEIGYHERVVVPALLRAITNTARHQNRRYEVVVKLHPKESPGAFADVYRELEGARLRLREVASCDNLRLIRSADHIFGMFSIIMVWSALLGQTTFSYQPNSHHERLLITAEDGVVPCCWRAPEMEGMVAAFLTDPEWLAEWRQRLAAWQPGPLDGVGKVVDLVRTLAHLGTGEAERR